MAKKAAPAKGSGLKSRMYEVSKEGKVTRKGQTCPRCGDGVFLAAHKDRTSCGKCGYTEYKK
ncbi:30S ribosomal protein S27ae [Methanocella sp. CWC-04]|uniref:Small ribosomal subunit protein eS31 n=1 Tax=Methanooceanicella nereidis TaxID=2052831 RepID=A0AAP2RDI4_9EURY|nr:30S ribosomal protein S27ae [Methanocella sp. CWC-04]MCD1294801.1 30S ribosomal protein S27ae [Methanocella sp. CWC-04]